MTFLKNIRYFGLLALLLISLGGFAQTVIPQCALLGSTGSVNSTGANTYQVLVNTTDFTAVCNGTDVDPNTGQWAMWTAKSNGCNRYEITNATTTATQILIDVIDLDSNGAPSNDFCAIIQEDDPCAVADFVASGGVFSLQSHNQCFSSYYKKLCSDVCCGGGSGLVVVDDDPSYFINNCVGGQTEYYDIFAHGLVSTPCTDASTITWTVTSSSGSTNESVSNVGILQFDPSFGTGFVEGTATCADGATDNWRIDFTCLSPTQCDPDSLFYLNETVDCAAGTVQVCFTTCGTPPITSITGVLTYDDTKIQVTGFTEPYNSAETSVNTATSGVIGFGWGTFGFSVSFPSGTEIFCVDFDIIGDISQGTTIIAEDIGGAFADNEYTQEEVGPVFVVYPFKVVPLSINCPSPLIFSSSKDIEPKYSRLFWFVLIALVIIGIIYFSRNRAVATVLAFALISNVAICQDGITGISGGAGGEIPDNELIQSFTTTATGLQLIDAGGTYNIPFTDFPFSTSGLNGMFDAANQNGTYAVDTWLSSANPSDFTLQSTFTQNFQENVMSYLGYGDVSGGYSERMDWYVNGWRIISDATGVGFGQLGLLVGKGSLSSQLIDNDGDRFTIAQNSVPDDNFSSGISVTDAADAESKRLGFLGDGKRLTIGTDLWVQNGHNATAIPDGWVLTKIGNAGINDLPIAEWQAPSGGTDTYITDHSLNIFPTQASIDHIDNFGTIQYQTGYNEGLGIEFSNFFGALQIDVVPSELLSTDAGQTATIGTDGKILVTGGTGADTYITNNALNVAGTTSDFALIDNNTTTQTSLSFFEGNGINYIDNLGRLEIEVDEAEIISTDANNSIVLGSDGKLYNSSAASELYINNHTLNIGGTTSDFALEDNTGATQTSLSFFEGLGIDFSDNLGRLEIAIAIADLISTDTPNGLTISANDGKLVVEPSALKSYEFEASAGPIVDLKTEGGFQIEGGRIIEVYVNGALVTGWNSTDGGDGDTLHDTLVFPSALTAGDDVSVIVR